MNKAKKFKLRVYMDTEFTSLSKDSQLLSIGLVAETGQEFYRELEYNPEDINPWVKENVLPYLTEEKISKSQLKEELTKWFEQFKDYQVEVWVDVGMWDWVLFTDIFGDAFSIPSNIHYIPVDMGTVFRMKLGDSDINRIEFSGLKDIRHHHALDDAKVIRACAEKLRV